MSGRKLEVKITGFIQVCELGLACQMLFLAGMGRRREDGDTLAVYPEQGEHGSIYVRKGSEWDKNANFLAVDEGYYNGALHRVGMSAIVDKEITPEAERVSGQPLFGGKEKRYKDTEVGSTWSYLEYVDMCSLLGALCNKLVPNAIIKGSEAMGRGRRQRDIAEQYVEYLRIWSLENPDHDLSFI
jgi:hypothetical protein